MSRDLKNLIRESAELLECDRATLAGILIESLDPKPTPEVRPAWSSEIARRVQEIESGSVELVSWDDVRAELFADE
jgi:putative addiction module component (TIGR02574 family)